MPKRKTDPETGEPVLTYRENKLVDGYVANGGNSTRAAIDAGYSPKRASQSAWNVLNRAHVQERIRCRIAEAQINPDEVFGSLASQMRADVTDCFDPDGGFSVELARQNGLGHLLKVSTTIHRKQIEDGSLRTVGDATKIEFLSPQAAARQLSKIKTIRDAKPGEAPQSEEARIAEKVTLIERAISRTMDKFPGRSREEIIDEIRYVKPELVPYLDRLPTSKGEPK